MTELIAGQGRVLIPDGKYTAQCISARKEFKIAMDK
jgi:hypothetical protein